MKVFSSFFEKKFFLAKKDKKTLSPESGLPE
jgi:hypothetical protein